MPSSMHDIDISLSLSLISCSNNELHHTLATPAPLQPPTRHPTGPNHPLSLSLSRTLDGRWHVIFSKRALCPSHHATGLLYASSSLTKHAIDVVLSLSPSLDDALLGSKPSNTWRA
jgi:hypothetical protein